MRRSSFVPLVIAACSSGAHHEPPPIVQNVGLAQVSQMSAGWRSSCALSADQSLWCWGENPGLLPKQIDGSFLSVGAGYPDICAVRVDGTLWCEGGDQAGSTWTTVTQSASLMCGLQSDGSAWCWYGASPTQISGSGWTTISVGEQSPWHGQRACGTQSDGTLRCWSDPSSLQQIAGTSWQSVATGSGFTCAVQSDATLWCWGQNDQGQLGLGAGPDVATPTQVPGAWSAVSAGQAHACGIQTDGSLWCWGINDEGELGDHSELASAVPVRVAGGGTWQSVSASVNHTCAVHGDGTGYCWGSNRDGQIGTGFVTGNDMSGGRTFPAMVAGGASAWDQVSAGGDYACATKLDDTLWCWGDNTYGVLGQGNTANAAVPTQVPGSGWTTVSANSSTCATRADGTLWCWGPNPAFATAAMSPMQLVSPGAGLTWTAATVGQTHSCALSSDQGLWCWGDNSNGELGTGTTSTTPRATPVRVAGTWSSASAGWNFTCALASDGGLWCWGGSGSVRGLTPTPTLIDAGPWLQVGAGSNLACALKADHSVWCWGERDLNPYYASTLTATGEADVSDLFVGSGDEVCTHRADGTLRCWGQFFTGDGQYNGSQQPQLVLGLGWEVAGVGYQQTCARKADRSLWCWGANFHGALGDGGEWYDAPVQVTGAMGPAPGSGPGLDTVPPMITAVTPNGAGADETGAIVVQFSKPVDPAIFTTSVIQLVEDDDGETIAGTLTLARDGLSARFQPLSPIMFGAKFDVTVTADLRDTSGNVATAPYRWSFTTREDPANAPPALSWVAPADLSNGNAPGTTRVLAKFSRQLDCTKIPTDAITVYEAGTAVAGSVTCNGSVLELIPTDGIPTNTQLHAQLAGSLCSHGGACQSASASWSFGVARWQLALDAARPWAHVTTDAAGNVYVGAVNNTTGYWVVDLEKHAPSSTLQWQDVIDSDAWAIAASPSGGIALVGNIPNHNTFGIDLVAGYAADGTAQWSSDLAAIMTNASGSVATSAAFDSAGDVYIAGTKQIPVNGGTQYNYDCFVASFDGTGQLRWTAQFGTIDSEECYAIAVDGSGHVYVAGTTYGSLGGTNLGGWDTFVVRFDAASGATQWTSQFGTTGDDKPTGIAVDGADATYVSGTALTKLDATGAVTWTRTPAASDVVNTIATIGASDILIAGASGGDGFVARVNSSGTELWRYVRSDPGNDEVQSVSISGNAIYLAGPTTVGGFYAAFAEKLGVDGRVR